jgi:hypothetical protein
VRAARPLTPGPEAPCSLPAPSWLRSRACGWPRISLGALTRTTEDRRGTAPPLRWQRQSLRNFAMLRLSRPNRKRRPNRKQRMLRIRRFPRLHPQNQRDQLPQSGCRRRRHHHERMSPRRRAPPLRQSRFRLPL